MENLPLMLFRRHKSSCSKGYPKEFRIYRDDSRKGVKQDCSCSIYAEGTLIKDGRKNYLRPKSTGKVEWNEASVVAADWVSWGGTIPPVASEPSPQYELRTLVDAIEQFYSTQRQNGFEDRISQYRHLLDLRLIPFAAAKHIEFIQQMDNAEIWGQFRQTWKNENPYKNRTPPDDAKKLVVPLGRNHCCPRR